MKTTSEPTWRVTEAIVVAVVIATLTLYEGTIQSVRAADSMAAPVGALYTDRIC
jgi:hypothetical protein